jgi:DNA-binding Lrp family transcriptional regulator
MTTNTNIDELDRAVIAATQDGLPLVERPFAAVADAIGCGEDAVLDCFRRMVETGRVRRIAVVPNHYSLGLRFNGMSVWDVADSEVSRLGRQVGALPFVTHCYQRPRVEGLWRYNLFAMVHGRDRAEAAGKVDKIAEVLGQFVRAHDVLFSTRILKKTGFRLQG